MQTGSLIVKMASTNMKCVVRMDMATIIDAGNAEKKNLFVLGRR